MKMADSNHPFLGCQQLYGKDYSKLVEARVAVVGLGGVGSWAAEALVRTGIGHLTLMDPDEICVNNTNRQLQAMSSTVGRGKASQLAERFRDINPGGSFEVWQDYLIVGHIQRLLAKKFDLIIDCIDARNVKSHFIAESIAAKQKIVIAGAAGGILDPASIRVDDIMRSYNDPLLKKVRKFLRQKYEISRDGLSIGVPCVFSTHTPVLPEIQACGADREAYDLFGPTAGGLSCENGLGTSCFVTGTMGFMVAGEGVRQILGTSQILKAQEQAHGD
jgi:tRNA A37 threonylcarbamoyladenosine dehydratase